MLGMFARVYFEQNNITSVEHTCSIKKNHHSKCHLDSRIHISVTVHHSTR